MKVISLCGPEADLFVGLLCDLLWSDPDGDVPGWAENERGVSFTFGQDVIANFLKKHDLDLICRAHQVIYWILNKGSKIKIRLLRMDMNFLRKDS
jgi:hypothetical protein